MKVHPAEIELQRVTRRLERERRARMEAEVIAEKATRELFDVIQNLQAEIAEHAQAKERTFRHLERLRALRSIDLAISASLDIRLTLNVVLSQVASQLKVDAVSILLMTNTRSLRYAVGHGFRTEDFHHADLRIGEGYAGRAALSRCRIVVPDIRHATGEVNRSRHLNDEGFVAYIAEPLISKGEVKAVMEVFHRQPHSPDKDWLEFLETLAGQAAIAIDNATLFEGLQKSNAELAVSYDATLEGWVRALDLRDKETEGHTQRVTRLTVEIASSMGVSGEDLVQIRRGALLHDVGKLGIPDRILLKPGALDEEEWAVMRMHPVYAFQWLSPIPYLRKAVDIPYAHHEKWDGSGYPRGLRGEGIPIAARMFAVVDIYDAITSDRPYRKAWTTDKAKDHILGIGGSHLDPEIVQHFMKMKI